MRRGDVNSDCGFTQLAKGVLYVDARYYVCNGHKGEHMCTLWMASVRW